MMRMVSIGSQKRFVFDGGLKGEAQQRVMNGSCDYRSGCKHTFEELEWRIKCMGSARSAAGAVGDGIEFVLTVDREVSALRQLLPQQPVGVLAGTALPWTVGIAEVHAHAGGGAKLLMLGHFLPWS